MELRNPIPWVRIAAEGVAIIVSILLAFTIDAWRQKRGELIREKALVDGLMIEFTTAERLVEELISDHRSNVSKFSELNTLLSDSTAITQENKIIDLSHALWRVQVYFPRMPIYENLINSIGLDAIQNENVRDALRLYQHEAIAQKGWDEYLKAFDQDLLVATLLPRLPFYQQVFPDDGSDSGILVDVPSLATDMEFRNIVAIRHSGESKLVELRLNLLQAVRDALHALETSKQ